jgi:hypothetical protein
MKKSSLAVASSSVLFLFLAGCGAKYELSDLQEVRVPVAQFFVEQTLAEAALAVAGKGKVGSCLHGPHGSKNQTAVCDHCARGANSVARARWFDSFCTASGRQ